VWLNPVYAWSAYVQCGLILCMHGLTTRAKAPVRDVLAPALNAHRVHRWPFKCKQVGMPALLARCAWSKASRGAVCRVPQAARKACEQVGVPYRDSLHAAGHAVLNVMPLYMICNPADIRTECENPYAVRYRPERLLVYDTHPGGLGLAVKVFSFPPPPRVHLLFHDVIFACGQVDLLRNSQCAFLRSAALRRLFKITSPPTPCMHLFPWATRTARK
jgi:hypothetical protein